jgi:hypothetical protein
MFYRIASCSLDSVKVVYQMFEDKSGSIFPQERSRDSSGDGEESEDVGGIDLSRQMFFAFHSKSDNVVPVGQHEEVSGAEVIVVAELVLVHEHQHSKEIVGVAVGNCCLVFGVLNRFRVVEHCFENI